MLKQDSKRMETPMEARNWIQNELNKEQEQNPTQPETAEKKNDLRAASKGHEEANITVHV